jgi:hypothetical protein
MLQTVPLVFDVSCARDARAHAWLQAPYAMPLVKSLIHDLAQAEPHAAQQPSATQVEVMLATNERFCALQTDLASARAVQDRCVADYERKLSALHQEHAAYVVELTAMHTRGLSSAASSASETALAFSSSATANAAELIRESRHEQQELLTNKLGAILQFSEESAANTRRFSKQNAAATIGNQGEDMLEVLLDSQLPGVEIIRTSRSARYMDFKLRTGDVEVLLDVKLYTEQVPSKEIDKFRADMLGNKSHGILLSLTSQIATKYPMQIDLVDNKLVAVYLGNNGLEVGMVAKALSVVRSLSSILALQQDEGKAHSNVLKNPSRYPILQIGRPNFAERFPKEAAVERLKS